MMKNVNFLMMSLFLSLISLSFSSSLSFATDFSREQQIEHQFKNDFIEDVDNKILDLRVGDILLISLDCYSCRVIEDETDSKFSHMGIVVDISKTSIKVAHALGRVHTVKLKKFFNFKRKGTDVKVIRSIELDQIHRSGRYNQLFLNRQVESFFIKYFKGLPYDHDFLWRNFDDLNREKLYCSEFVAKFINNFLKSKIKPKPMTFNRHFQFWINYFDGDIPTGQLGLSPEDFNRSKLFYEVMYLNAM